MCLCACTSMYVQIHRICFVWACKSMAEFFYISFWGMYYIIQVTGETKDLGTNTFTQKWEMRCKQGRPQRRKFYLSKWEINRAWTRVLVEWTEKMGKLLLCFAKGNDVTWFVRMCWIKLRTEFCTIVVAPDWLAQGGNEHTVDLLVVATHLMAIWKVSRSETNL